MGVPKGCRGVVGGVGGATVRGRERARKVEARTSRGTRASRRWRRRREACAAPRREREASRNGSRSPGRRRGCWRCRRWRTRGGRDGGAPTGIDVRKLPRGRKRHPFWKIFVSVTSSTVLGAARLNAGGGGGGGSAGRDGTRRDGGRGDALRHGDRDGGRERGRRGYPRRSVDGEGGVAERGSGDRRGSSRGRRGRGRPRGPRRRRWGRRRGSVLPGDGTVSLGRGMSRARAHVGALARWGELPRLAQAERPSGAQMARGRGEARTARFRSRKSRRCGPRRTHRGDDEVAGLLLGEGGDADALAEVAGRVAADAVPEPLGDESMLPLDSDDDEGAGDDPLRDPVLVAAMESGERARVRTPWGRSSSTRLSS